MMHEIIRNRLTTRAEGHALIMFICRIAVADSWSRGIGVAHDLLFQPENPPCRPFLAEFTFHRDIFVSVLSSVPNCALVLLVACREEPVSGQSDDGGLVIEDCLLLFPFQRCDGSEVLGYVNNRPVNAKYYEASGAQELEGVYRNSCKLQRLFDGGPVKVSCVNGICGAAQTASCH